MGQGVAALIGGAWLTGPPRVTVRRGVGSIDGQLKLATNVLCNQAKEFEPYHVGLGASAF